MKDYNYFQLQRQSDDLVYEFDKAKLPNGETGFKRRDQDLWITYKPKLGWVAYGEAEQELYGRAWNVLPENQEIDHPPEGVWISRKGVKSYVYEFKYTKAQ